MAELRPGAEEGKEGGRGKRRREGGREGGKKEPGSPSRSGACPVSLRSPLARERETGSGPRQVAQGSVTVPSGSRGQVSSAPG